MSIQLVYSDVNPSVWGFKDSSYDKYLAHGAKQTPGMHWDPQGRYWWGWEESAKILYKWLNTETPHAGHLAPPPHHFYCNGVDFEGLRPYQQAGYHWLCAHEKGILADEMGLGKSLQALRATSHGPRRLIIAPNTAKDVWRGELKKWGEREAFEPKGTKVEGRLERYFGNTNYRTALIHYELVSHWEQALAQWNPTDVIVDEATAVGRSDSQKAKAVSFLVSAKGRRAVALTGTPLANRPHDLWHLVETIWPGRLGSFHQFGVRYCGAHQEETRVRGGEVKQIWKYDRLVRADELKWRLDHFLLRRTLEEVGLELPPKLRQVIWVDLNEKSGKPPPTSPRGIQLELQRLTDKKLGKAVDFIADLVSQGEKVVSFAHRREVADLVANGVSTKAKQGAAIWVIHGGVSNARRAKILGEARAFPGPSLLSVTYDTCGMGLDFTYASVGVVAEPSYEPHKILQGEARLHRPGQTRPTRLIYFMGRGTLDERIARVVIDKLDEKWAPLFGGSGALSDDFSGKEEDLISEILGGVGQ